MRKIYLTMAIAAAACVSSPLTLAQTRDTSASAIATTAQSQTTDAARDRAGAPKMPKSAFGQVMAALTHLLQEAATKQAKGMQPDAGLADPSNSALTITVTPIEGQTTFAVDNADNGTAVSIDDDAATDAQIERAPLAVQGEDGAG